jgi:hypothetical protein
MPAAARITDLHASDKGFRYAPPMASGAVDVVLLSTPFYRLCGSHNDRAPLSLCYLSSYLERAGISHVVVNADHTGSDRYWSMRWMFDNFQPFIDAVDGRSSLYGEVVERVMSYSPRSVVILGGEPLIATKDWTDPFVGAHFSELFRKLGVHTIGFGHFYSLDTERFVESFDCVLRGEPSETIVPVVTNQTRGVVDGSAIDLDVRPLFTRCDPAGYETDFVMTSFGCRFPCSFCLVQRFYGSMDRRVRFVDLPTVADDIEARVSDRIYITDLTFTYAPKSRLRQLVDTLKERSLTKEYTIDTRVDRLGPEVVDLLCEMGVRTVKIGVEGITKRLLDSFDKGINFDQVADAVARLRAAGLEVVTYLLIGGPGPIEDYATTRNYIRRIGPDFVPVAIWAYRDLAVDYRYETQFSPVTLEKWGIDPQVFYDYVDLQREVNPTVGAMLDVPSRT